MTASSHSAGEGPLIDVARTIGSTLGTVAATMKKARRLATGAGPKRVRRKAATARTKVRQAVKRDTNTARRRVRSAAKRASATARRVGNKLRRTPTRTSAAAKRARSSAKRSFSAARRRAAKR
jgi:hypothetical protein